MTEGTDPTQELRFDRTQEIPTEALQTQQPGPGQKDFKTGVAAVPAQRQVEHTVSFEPTLAPGQIVTSGHLKRPDVPFGVRMRQLKAGGRWSVAGAIFLLVSWGLWAASAGADSDHASATLALFLIVLVGVGLFALCRLVGGVVLEKLMGRSRRSAWLSHAVIGVYLVVAGGSYLSSIGWVVDAWNFLRGVR
ncbi:hypothetical protein [Catellatospora citrea]|uniref:Uncharacterized protein n=1 Tax=Catellatospora citrea TaxID=53366 RepID=A0A8J3KL73_9ACTN|nr:hypothetical protein [Catellatospora citrea]GIF99198.1 hypothetical protein Cci01nite_42920 [Catellatospora citrea]